MGNRFFEINAENLPFWRAVSQQMSDLETPLQGLIDAAEKAAQPLVFKTDPDTADSIVGVKTASLADLSIRANLQIQPPLWRQVATYFGRKPPVLIPELPPGIVVMFNLPKEGVSPPEDPYVGTLLNLEGILQNLDAMDRRMATMRRRPSAPTYPVNVLRQSLLRQTSPSLARQYSQAEKDLFGPRLHDFGPANDPPETDPLTNFFNFDEDKVVKKTVTQMLINAFSDWYQFITTINSTHIDHAGLVKIETLERADSAIARLKNAIDFSTRSSAPIEVQAILSRWDDIYQIALQYWQIQRKPIYRQNKTALMNLARRSYQLGLNHFAHVTTHVVRNIINFSGRRPNLLAFLQAQTMHNALHAIEGGDELMLSTSGEADPFSYLYLGVMFFLDTKFGGFVAGDGALNLAQGAQGMIQPGAPFVYDNSLFLALQTQANAAPEATALQQHIAATQQAHQRALFKLKSTSWDHLTQGISDWTTAARFLGQVTTSEIPSNIAEPLSSVKAQWAHVIETLEEFHQWAQSSRQEIWESQSLEAARTKITHLQESARGKASKVRELGFELIADKHELEWAYNASIANGITPQLIESSLLGPPSLAGTNPLLHFDPLFMGVPAGFSLLGGPMAVARPF